MLSCSVCSHFLLALARSYVVSRRYSEALEALLSEWGAPPSVHQAYWTGLYHVGFFGFCVPASLTNAQETFILNVWGLDPADPSAMMQPEAARLRRLLASACALQLPGLSPASSQSMTPAPAATSAKLTSAEVQALRRTFQQGYTAKLLMPETMPSNSCPPSNWPTTLVTLSGFLGGFVLSVLARQTPPAH